MINPTLKGFIKKELLQALRDVRMRTMLFLMPVIQIIVFGLALSTEVKNIRLVVFSDPHDSLARDIESRALASGWFIPGRRPFEDPPQLIQSGYADAVAIAPRGGLGRSIERGEGRIQLLVDATNAIRARGIENYFNAILQNVVEDQRSDTEPLSIVHMEIKMLFNPSMRTPVYLVPGVMSLILGLLTVILTAMSMAREKEMGTFETLISAPVSKWEVLLGKTLPFVILAMIDVPLIVGATLGIFKIPFRGEVWELFIASFFFICTTVSVGTLISTFAKNQQQAMLGGFIFLFPAIQLSGVMAPLDNIPLFFKWISYLNPLRFFVTLLRNIMLKGGEPSVFWPNIGALALLCALSILLASRRFQKTLN